MSRANPSPWMSRFHNLMPGRVRDILLVSSDYDAFVLEEDGRLSDRLFVRYSELNLSSLPNIVHVPTADDALLALKERRFDLVLTTMRVEDPGVRGLSAWVKSLYPELPVVLLVLDQVELKRLAQRPLPPTIDRVFLWTGDTRILLAIIKLVEDAHNVDHDTSKTGVQVIIVVEDSVLAYSAFLALLYSELMAQSQSLIAEGVNALHKLLRMRARPKILLATTDEAARAYYERHRNHVLAVISDVQFPSGGRLDDEAGYRLAADILKDRSLPILLQSANPDSAARAEALKVAHLDKNSPGLLNGLQRFLKDNLGFGDFVFRLPDFTELARASDMYQLIRVLEWVDSRSLHYHATSEHFNVWLRARSMFDLADQVALVKMDQFEDIEAARTHLLDLIRGAAEKEQLGVVTDFSPNDQGPSRWFTRLGQGSLGGKGRGIAFLHYELALHNLARAFPDLSIRVPRTLVLATDLFDSFLSANQLSDATLLSPDELQERFQRAYLPQELRDKLHGALAGFSGPLAVRSSSLLEDSQHQSCAGIYNTVLLPRPDVDAVCAAVLAVYASTYSDRARAYLNNTPFSLEDERMAVVIQELVGQAHEGFFYPHISGVALSWNHYPVEPQRAEDGAAQLALGLGHIIVGGGRSVRFAPGAPAVLPHLTSPREFLPYSQNYFLALNLENGELCQLDLSHAERDGTLGWVASVYSADDDQLRDNLRASGPRVITFSNILRWGAIPLDRALDRLLRLLRDGMGSPVEIEFAVDLPTQGPACLYLLQVRPLAEPAVDLTIELPEFYGETVLCASPRSVGHGIREDIRDIVYVLERDLDSLQTCAVAAELAPMNAALLAEGAPYLLIGPGRWGSSDPSLGIPVDIAHILGAAVIVELPFENRYVEPSSGSHFFHEMVSRRIGYLCLPTLDSPEAYAYLDLDWLASQPPLSSGTFLRHLRLQKPLIVMMDGVHGKSLILSADHPDYTIHKD